MLIFFAFQALELPGEDKIAATIGKTTDSATGPDGVPYSAYKANTELSAKLLYNS